MPTGPVELRSSIDRAWLEAAGERDPVAHAYALWDLDRFPDLVRFVSAVRGEETVAYLLLWQARGRSPVVHWVGPPVPELASALPPRPLIVIGPEEVGPLVERARGPGPAVPILIEAAPAGTRPAPTERDPQVRRLTHDDRVALELLAREAAEVAGTGYLGLDLSSEVVYGGFEGPTLVGVARAVVRRPTIWLVSGVYVRPEHRGRGWARAIARAVLLEAAQAGAPTALFVREDRAPARALYERLGFHPVGRRVWVDCGTGLSP